MLLSFKRLRSKLIAICMLITLFALVALSGAVLRKVQQLNTQALFTELQVFSSVIKDAIYASLEFEDYDSITNIIQNVTRPNPNIELVCIYAKDSVTTDLITTITRGLEPLSANNCKDQVFSTRLDSSNNYAELSTFLRRQTTNEIIGSVYIRVSTKSIYAVFDDILYTIISILILILLLAYIIATIFGKLITQPLRDMRDIAHKITLNKDYSLRAHKTTNDELGFLVTSFNDMLDTIEKQNDALVESQHKLGDLVTALSESEEHFRVIFEQAGDSIILVDLDTLRFYEYNKIAHLTLGYTREEFSKLTVKEISRPIYPEQSSQLRLSDEYIPRSFETKLISKSGEELDVNVSAQDVVIRKRPFRVLILRDITEQKRIDREVVSLNSRMRAVLDSATQVAIIATDLEGNINVFNRGAELLLKYSQTEILDQKNLTDMYLESELKAQQQRIASELSIKCNYFQALTERVNTIGIESGSWHYVAADDEQIPVQVTLTGIRDHIGQLRGFLCMAYDLRSNIEAEQKRTALEAQLQQSQKMETIGTLAGGIAHDLNNLLTPIVGYTEMVMQDIDAESKQYRFLDRVIQGAIRAKKLVKQILTFSHQVKQQTQAFLMSDIINEVVKLLEASLPPTIKLTAEFKDPDLVIKADTTQIHQVLMNLCTNAAHALGDTEGVLSITLEKAQIDETQVDEAQSGNLSPGSYAKVSVTDNGSGMSESTLKRIFEPFFTTKAVGEGTGLGLSVAHGIIKNHKGDIQVESQLEHGTSFHVYIPLVDEQVTPMLALQDQEHETASILYIDDEEEIAEMACEMLERQGYTVTMAIGSLEAWDIYQSRPDDFDVVISDQTMPVMKGTDLATKIHEQNPKQPILLVTGLGGIIEDRLLEQVGINEVINKPVVINDLVSAITRVLSN
jgi:PAS domain S-box-containing protein